jgi:hypothetical protein
MELIAKRMGLVMELEIAAHKAGGEFKYPPAVFLTEGGKKEDKRVFAPDLYSMGSGHFFEIAKNVFDFSLVPFFSPAGD